MAGGPLKSLNWLAAQLIQDNHFLKAGDLVIPGSPVQLIPVTQGDHIKVSITNLGKVEAFIK
jgi:2-keto-4-pentenoate hydratase